MSFLLPDKAEQAFVQVIKPNVDLTIAGVLPGKNADDKKLPRVVVFADGDGDEDPKGTGNFWLTVEVQIKQSALKGGPNGRGAKDADQDLVDAVLLPLQDDNLPALLSAAVPDFTVFPNAILREAPKRGYDESGAWVDSMVFRVYCCGTALPA